ncbi:LuxR C-terminal-related transcriptional regulator [Brevundimonas sp. 2R-24]|uniref:LuxR C-terminal-related transcriptional regulator n=1 Tax=Peiella sedimenti TaxID=3061083 RepID=A0ABT8SM38_9CAUL|nr:LuxR C-terminal-related transcriptional regulator [Caulobacteraceae bacterium XZ-24]
MNINSPADSWFALDPTPLFVVDEGGRLVCANPAGTELINDGRLLANGSGVLSFGSSGCDSDFLAAVRAVVGRGGQSRLVLRQRHGGWVGATLHGVQDGSLVIVSVKAEASPSVEAMEAIGSAFHLTTSETDVLYGLLTGGCPKSVATALRISEHTVRAHLRDLYAKMNVRGLNGMIRTSCTFL